MGIVKIFFFLTAPIAGMTWAAFSLGKQLPKASRLFGNYIGLSYIYFKSILKVLKPKDHLPFQTINMARQASQQADALRRQLRNTIAKAKDQFRNKKQEIFKDLEKQIEVKQNINQLSQENKKTIKEKLEFFNNQDIIKQQSLSKKEEVSKNCNNILYQIQKERENMLKLKIEKIKSEKFYKNI